MTTYCVVCRGEIPPERAAKRCNTDTKECKRLLARIRRQQADAKRCRHCSKPSTPEERALYRAWRRAQFGAVKRGRPAKQPEATA